MPARFFIVLIILLTFQTNVNCQININGFGKTAVYNTLPGYSNILQVNFNGDDYSDIMIFDHSLKRFVIHTGQKENTFSKPIDKFFFYPISNVKFLQSRPNEQNLYLFISRSERLAGLTSFTKYGTLQLLNLKKFDSYPSNISVADIDLNGVKDALISGPAFDGLSILTQDKLSLKETKIVSKRYFLSAEFIDLNLDGFQDIAAIDLVENSITVFINNRQGKFVETNQIKYFDKATNLKICNFNNDDYDDISFLINNRLEIILGDSVSSLENKLNFDFSFIPSNYEIADLNNDNINDLILVNPAKDRVEIYYRKRDQNLPLPEIYFNHKNISSVKVLQRGNAKRLAALSLNGELFVTGKITNTQNTFKFSAGSYPNLFTQSNKTHFIIYGDKDNTPSLNIFTGNSVQRFQMLTSIPLLYDYNKFALENNGYGNYNFYLYSDKLIEIVSFSEFDYSIDKKFITPYAPPIDIRIVDDKQIEAKYAHLLFINNGLLGIENIEIDDKNVLSQGIDIIDSNVVNAIIAEEDFEEVHYWKYVASILTFNSVRQYEDVNLNFVSQEFVVNSSSIPEISFSFIGSANKKLVSVVSYNDNTYFYLFDGKKFDKLNQVGQKKQYSFIMPKILTSVKTKNPNQYILYDKLSESFKKVDFNLHGKKIKINNYIESKGVNGYFVSKFFENNLYLFYSDTLTNLITITKIE